MKIKNELNLCGQFVTQVEQINHIIQYECEITEITYDNMELIKFRLQDAIQRIEKLQRAYINHLEKKIKEE